MTGAGKKKERRVDGFLQNDTRGEEKRNAEWTVFYKMTHAGKKKGT